MAKPRDPSIAIQPLPSPPGVRVGIDALDPSDLNGSIATWLKALAALKANGNFEDEMSYFRLAAIHGSPYVGWDGEQSRGPGVERGNFCTHGENTFPTWHRVYMLLFETALYNLIPDSDPNKASFRLPYWDWAKNDDGDVQRLPVLLSSQFWPPSSTIENPLWKFENPRKGSDGQPIAFGDKAMGEYLVEDNMPSLPWSVPKATSRCTPRTQDLSKDPDFINGNVKMDMIMANFKAAGWYNLDPNDKTQEPPPYKTIQDYVYVLFCWTYKTYNSFATATFDPTPGTKGGHGWLSLEYLHNNLHNWIGGINGQIGHMNDVPVAAFDPIFWLHHSFIDALFTKWQSLEKNSQLWLDHESATKPLTPFHIDENHTAVISDDVKRASDWNYSYTDFPSERDSQEELVKMINHNYGSGLQHIVKDAQHHFGDHPNDYIINVLYNRHALDQAYKIHFFLGNDNEVTIPETRSKHIGSVYTFSNSGSQSCANCAKQKAEHQLSRAQVLLTVPLIHRHLDGVLSSLHPGHKDDDGVKSFLIKHLTWTVFKLDGTPVPIQNNEDMADLKIILAHGKADHFPDDPTKLSVFHEDTYRTFWQGSYPGQSPDAPANYILKNPE